MGRAWEGAFTRMTVDQERVMRVRIPLKTASASNLKPITDSDRTSIVGFRCRCANGGNAAGTVIHWRANSCKIIGWA